MMIGLYLRIFGQKTTTTLKGYTKEHIRFLLMQQIDNARKLIMRKFIDTLK